MKKPALAFTGLVFATGLLFSSDAVGVMLQITPERVSPGGAVNLFGVCDPNADGYVISEAFKYDKYHEFAGTGAINFRTDYSGNFVGSTTVPYNTTPDTYDVTVRCGDENLGTLGTLTVAKPPPALENSIGTSDPYMWVKVFITFSIISALILTIGLLFRRL
jgi:hypothetical protein